MYNTMVHLVLHVLVDIQVPSLARQYALLALTSILTASLVIIPELASLAKSVSLVQAAVLVN